MVIRNLLRPLSRQRIPTRQPPSSYKNTLGHETWASFEIKYPDFEEEAVEWAPLWNAINFTATANDTEFEKDLKTRFDYPVLKDYYLFIELLLATDNHGKNMFYYVYDRTGAEGDRLGIGPWDLDGVWGARWDGSTYMTGPDQDFDSFIEYNEHGTHTLFIRLRRAKTIDWQSELAERYAELRQRYFNTNYLNEAVDHYKTLFVSSAADRREQQRWGQYHPQVAQSADYLKTWMEQRIKFLDEKYGFDPIASAVNEAISKDFFHSEGGTGLITISCGSPCRVSVYNLSGRLIKSEIIEAGCHELKGLTPGVYLVNSEKVIVR